MCTISWQRPAGNDEISYQLWFNRDERRTRILAEGPQVRSSGENCSWISPRDPEGGGTWMGVNQDLITIALLNAYPLQFKSEEKPRSRGQLVVDALTQVSFTGLADQQNWLSDACHSNVYRPFYLVMVSDESEASWLWDGKTVRRHSNPGDRFLTSSSWRSDEVGRYRKALFEKEDKENSLDGLHHHHDPELPKHSVKMYRDDAQTVSVSKVTTYTSGKVDFHYESCHEAESTGESEVVQLSAPALMG